MLLLFGGTTEGRTAVKVLEEAGKPYYYSTRGDEQDIELHHGSRLTGTLDREAIIAFCRSHGIGLLVDAAHPFAAELHANIAAAAAALSLPAIRLERIYPDVGEAGITWCSDYDDATGKLLGAKVENLLALTGVQSIGKLARLWREEGVPCRFRILDRESSRRVARRQGLPDDRLCYYPAPQAGEPSSPSATPLLSVEEERAFLAQLHPAAVLLKESGLSGGFLPKVEAARSLGIPLFILRRPPLPPGFRLADGPHGLRRRIERLLPGYYPLRSGLTTGTCATAAAVAATWDLLHPQAEEARPEEFPVRLPDGETIPVRVNPQTEVPRRIRLEDGTEAWGIEASVTKDAGDDPDMTNGMEVKAQVIVPLTPSGNSPVGGEQPIEVRGGRGVGTVTLPGLGLEVGGAAINDTPRQMMVENVRLQLRRMGIRPAGSPLIVTVSVPGGEEVARRTFNPRLGITGGISIIGTSGIVKPFSSDAFTASIRRSLQVAKASGSPRVVLSSGAKSEGYVRACYPQLPLQAFVHYGNFIGETLQAAEALQLPRLTLAMMIGKAVKLAAGNLDTHSKHTVMDKQVIRRIAARAGADAQALQRIEAMTLARELWDILPSSSLPRFCSLLLRECHRHCAPLVPSAELTMMLVSEQGESYLMKNEE